MKKLILLSILLIVGCEEVLEPEDCAGVAGGTAVTDQCGTCDKDSTNDCVQDCAGVWGGNATSAECDACTSGTFDCAGICDGDATSAECDACTSGTFDCAGACDGTAVEDGCGVCDSDTSNDCVQDCASVWGGTSWVSDCGCVSATNSGDDCDDCNGTPNGTAITDCEGVCNGSAIDTDEDGLCDSSEMVTDIDGNTYSNVKIGNQVLMAENLRVTHYRNGDPIPNPEQYGTTDWVSYDEGHYGRWTNNYPPYDELYIQMDNFDLKIYGNLYNWAAVNDERGICPDGFHVLTDEEWMKLEMELGMSEETAALTGIRGTNEGSKLAGHSELWEDGGLKNDSEFGISGFNAVLNGYRSTTWGGKYEQHQVSGDYWSATQKDEVKAWSRSISKDYPSIWRSESDRRYGFSVRCIKD